MKVMSRQINNFSIGIEEEYLIVDPNTGELSSAIENILKDGHDKLGNHIATEMLQCQVEVATPVADSIQEAREKIIHARKTVHDIAQSHGLAIIAAGTHPFSKWANQNITERTRYLGLVTENKVLARQLLICGMHMHVGLEDDDLRIDLMNQLSYFCPHLLALSASSPFWDGYDTGLQSYRSVVFEALPRTGIPPRLRSWGDYMEYIDVAMKTNCIDEPTKIRWDLRPSPKFPTLEYRICDVCTKVDEAIAICALKIALVAKLLKLRRNNMSWRVYRKELIQENKWRAVRYGLNGKLLDLGRKREVDAKKLIFELLTFVDDVLDEVGIRDEVSYIHNIVTEGNSADRQLRVFEQTGEMKAVVDHLIKETVQGVA
ncbi:MAG: carboxylate-amine ligase YbdK [Bacteroidetes bacterium HLUCCA01]|nr:MAG: carboxylate-amine ligase YbdK [Bacteroidetes bacterium HLUCCA01]